MPLCYPYSVIQKVSPLNLTLYGLFEFQGATDWNDPIGTPKHMKVNITMFALQQPKGSDKLEKRVCTGW